MDGILLISVYTQTMGRNNVESKVLSILCGNSKYNLRAMTIVAFELGYFVFWGSPPQPLFFALSPPPYFLQSCFEMLGYFEKGGGQGKSFFKSEIGSARFETAFQNISSRNS